MSDLPPPVPSPEPSSALPGAEQEIEVDLAAFLPEGVQFGAPDDGVDVDVEVTETVVAAEGGAHVIDEVEAVIATDDEVVIVDAVVVDGVVVAETVVAEDMAERPAVDLEALSQIERDLDAVDAAIAALDAGTYGTDPATGQLIDDALLAENPTRLS